MIRLRRRTRRRRVVEARGMGLFTQSGSVAYRLWLALWNYLSSSSIIGLGIFNSNSALNSCVSHLYFGL